MRKENILIIETILRIKGDKGFHFYPLYREALMIKPENEGSSFMQIIPKVNFITHHW